MSDVEHLFTCLLAICMSFFRETSVWVFSHFLIGLFVFLVWSWMSCLYILEITPLSVVSFAIIFSHSEGCLFTLLIVSFAVQNLLSLIRSHCYAQVAKSPNDHQGAGIQCKNKRVFYYQARAAKERSPEFWITLLLLGIFRWKGKKRGCSGWKTTDWLPSSIGLCVDFWLFFLLPQ